MKKTLSKIAMGLFIVAAIAVNAIPLLASSNYSEASPAETYIMLDDPAHCLPGYHWSHCILSEVGPCDVHAQHEDCEKTEETE